MVANVDEVEAEYVVAGMVAARTRLNYNTVLVVVAFVVYHVTSVASVNE